MSDHTHSRVIRRTTASDKEAVLSILDNVYNGCDLLPPLYDYILSLPNVYPAAMCQNDKMIGFLFAYIVDNGMTAVIRTARISAEFQGNSLVKDLVRFVSKWAVEKGVKSIISVEDECLAPGERKFERFKNSVLSWQWFKLIIDVQKLDSSRGVDSTDLVTVSSEDLSALFKDHRTRDYIARKGILLINWVPLKPLEDNILCILGPDGLPFICSDVNVKPDGIRGLLTSCTTRISQNRSNVDYHCTLDIFGTDSTSLRKHITRHLRYLKETIRGKLCLEIRLPEGIESEKVYHVLSEWFLENSVGDSPKLSETLCFRLHLYELWRHPETHLATEQC